MKTETKTETLPEMNPRTLKSWYRPRVKSRFSGLNQQIYASPTFWQNLPRKSILNAPGNKYQPRPLGDKFKKGCRAAARVVQKFFDREGRGFARLSTGTVIKTNEMRDPVAA